VPVIVTVVLPATGPELGLILATVGGGTYVKRSATPMALVWPETETVTSTVPVPAGLTAMQLVLLAQTTRVAAAGPKLTVVRPVVSNAVPVIMTVLPPPVGPLAGEIPVTVRGT